MALVRLLFGLGLSAAAQTPAGNWMDLPLSNWNASSARLPVANSRNYGIDPQCKTLIRAPAGTEDRALMAAGWTLYGPQFKFGGTIMISGESGADGMCRPGGYNYFVFYKGKFAGTVSPAAMDARTDGATTAAHLDQEQVLTAEFARYSDLDPLCCPSRTSYVRYRIVTKANGPVLMPEMVYTGRNLYASQ